jgi:hypothetical protein
MIVISSFSRFKEAFPLKIKSLRPFKTPGSTNPAATKQKESFQKYSKNLNYKVLIKWVSRWREISYFIRHEGT